MDDIRRWLETLGLDEYVDRFATNRISADVLPDLTEDDLEKLAIPLGDRKRLLRAIALLREQRGVGTSEVTILSPSEAVSDEDGEFQDLSLADQVQWRQLTLMFVDLVGSTTLSERLDLEEYCAVIKALHESSITILREHNGFIAQFQGDGLLAYFGYPRAEEDDAERAVMAGLAIVSAAGEIESEPGILLQARVGIATGLVAVGDLIGKGIADKRMVAGETPNLAARLQALAEPGTVVVSDVTRNLLGNQFICEDLGPSSLKGFLEPVRLWRVREVRYTTSRFQSHQRGILTPFVGREEEIELLHRRWNSARECRGQTVLISGEPGIGKSRLSEVFCNQIVYEPHSVLHFQCLPNQMGSPFHPVITELEHAIGFANGPSQTEKLDKLESWVHRELPGTPDAVAVFAKLLSIPTNNRYAPLELEPREFKNIALRLLFDQITGLLEESPAVLIFEDLQWIDPTSQEFLDALIDLIGEWRLFLVCTCRPEYHAQWIGDANVTYLSLRRLDSGQSAAMLEKVPGGVGLPPEVKAEILTKTDGVPLFLEELTKTVLESGLLCREGPAYTLDPNSDVLHVLPSTLLGSLLARLDRIAGAQEVAPIGAAIGRTFGYEVLREVIELDEQELQSILSRLLDAQLLSQHGYPPEATYKFKHALVQDAAYATLPKNRRREVHSRIATTLVERFPEISTGKPEIIAYHFDRSDAPADALGFWREAAVLALQRSPNVEAVSHIHNALIANEHTENADIRVSNEIQLRELLHVPLKVARWGSKGNAENLDRLRRLHEARGDTKGLLLVLHGICTDHYIGGRVSDARLLAEKMLQMSSDNGEYVGAVLGNRCLGFCDFLSADFRRSVAHFEKTIESCGRVDRDEIKKYYYADSVLTSRAMIAWSLVLSGEVSEAKKVTDLVTQMTEDEADIHSKTYALSILASIHQSADDPDASFKLSSQALILSQDHGYRYWEAWAQILKGWALALRGGHNQGIGDLEDGIVKYEATGARQMLPYARTLLADAYCSAGHVAEGLGTIQDLENDEEFKEIRYVDVLTARIRKCLPASAS
jgi:class 3 adenylate cyclase/tetratricopeptide (TPR) repeat protein